MFVVAHQQDHLPPHFNRFILQMEKQLINFPRIVTSVHNVTRLHEDSGTPDPRSLVLAEHAGELEGFNTGHEIAMQIRDGDNPPAGCWIKNAGRALFMFRSRRRIHEGGEREGARRGGERNPDQDEGEPGGGPSRTGDHSTHTLSPHGDLEVVEEEK